MNKKQIIALIAFLVVVAAVVGIYFATRPQTQEGAKEITVTVVHKDGTSKDFTYRTDEEYLGPVLTAEGLIVGEGGMYNTVDGETADYAADQSYWALYVGEEYAMQGADETPIADGDVFKWVYTVYQGE